MRRIRLVLLACAIWFVGVVAPAAAPAVTTAQTEPPISLTKLVSGLGKITSITDAADSSGRLFLTEKPGYIWIYRDGEVLPQPFLDVQSPVRAKGNEQGLLGLAFHPDYEHNGIFFISYTDDDGAVTLARYRVSADDPDRADPESGETLIVIPKKREDHNGGMLQFGPDGFLYLSVGDGGAESEPDRNAQRLDTLLGKILRIDVDREENDRLYTIPRDNPFAGVAGAMPEIWAYGLRNPWRFSFDRATGDLYIADVGLWQAEEIDVQPAGSRGGINYGWNVMEGNFCRDQAFFAFCASGDLALPVHVYFHDQGCAIVGGYVYRGAENPALTGRYIFGDYCLGTIWTLQNQGGTWIASNPHDTGMNISTFGEDENGELYVADLKGRLFAIDA